MDLAPGSLFSSLVVSSLGFGLFLYGKRQTRMPQLVIGLVMMIYPYFVAGPVATWSIAVALLLAMALALRMDL